MRAARCHNWMQHRRRAAAASYALILLPVLFGLTALTVDLGYLYVTKAELQSALDSAALAAVSVIAEGPAAARARARDYMERNPVYQHVVPLQDGDIELGRWDKATRTFTSYSGEAERQADSARVTGHLTQWRGNAVGLFFGPVLGRPTADVSAKATAQFGTSRNWDVFIVQDVSGSFNADLATAQLALIHFVECLRHHAGPLTRVGLVSFEVDAELIWPLQPAAGPVEDAINDLRGCCMVAGCCPPEALPNPWCSEWAFCQPPCRTCWGTNIAAGLELATVSFPPPLENTYGRAIVLFTDGMPNVAVDGQPGGEEQVPIAQARTIAAANAAFAADPSIWIFVVYYGDTPGVSSFLLQVVRPAGAEGMYYSTPDPLEFDTLLWQICARMPGGLRE